MRPMRGLSIHVLALVTVFCPVTLPVFGLDEDADGVDELLDCDDRNPQVWMIPGAVHDLRVAPVSPGSSGTSMITWSSPEKPGANVTSLSYNILRSTAAFDFDSPPTVCIEFRPETFVSDAERPTPGKAFVSV